MTNAPETALAVTGNGSCRYYVQEGAPAVVTFHRLGNVSRSALAHYTTRDITATAGQDYMPQSGVVTFAPFETEKKIAITTLEDSIDEFEEMFEIVITGGEGFEALPAPQRVKIRDPGIDLSPPRLDIIKRLRNGQVIFGGPAQGFIDAENFFSSGAGLEFSSDLKTWQPLTNLIQGSSANSTFWLDASATNSSTASTARWRGKPQGLIAMKQRLTCN